MTTRHLAIKATVWICALVCAGLAGLWGGMAVCLALTAVSYGDEAVSAKREREARRLGYFAGWHDHRLGQDYQEDMPWADGK